MEYIRKIYSVACKTCIESALWYNVFYMHENKNNIEVIYVS